MCWYFIYKISREENRIWWSGRNGVAGVVDFDIGGSVV